MATKSRLGIEVGDTETEIIEPTETVTNENREFKVKNGEKEIIVTAWGSESDNGWEVETSKTISPNDEDTLTVGPSHDPWLKLTARTTSPRETSTVDGYLTYTEPN